MRRFQHGGIITILISGFFSILIVNEMCLADTAVSIEYGIIDGAQTVNNESSHAGGAVVGGLLGAAISGPKNRGLKILGSAAAGAAVQGVATGGMVQQYKVKLRTGAEILVSTEQNDFRVGDCVSVERGQHTNMRRVSSIHCEPPHDTKPPEHHKTSANDCKVAKDQLTAADTDEELDIAITKVRILCED